MRSALFCFLGLWPLLLAAQTLSDTEAQRRRAQQRAEEAQSRQGAPDVRLQSPLPTEETTELPVETPCVVLDRVLLEGERLASFDGLKPLLDRLVGRCVGPRAINQVVQQASARLLAKGFITTRIGVPEQDLSTGQLRFVLIPGIVRAIRIVGEARGLSWRSAFPVRPGDLLNLRDIEQGLEQMKRVPSQDVSIDIAPGEAPGESDILLTVKNETPWRLGLSLDDAGARTTGRRQASVSASFDNPLGINDLLSASFIQDADRSATPHGSRGYTLMYSFPWGNWTFSYADSASDYLQGIQGINQNFETSGVSRSREFKLQRLVYRDQSAKTTLQCRVLKRTARSYIEDVELLGQRRHTVALELGVAHRQAFGAAQLDLALANRQGVRWLGGERDGPDHLPDSPTFDTTIQTLDATMTVPFSVADRPLRWIGTVRAQTTRDVLYAADFFSIGSRYTVRGFDGNATLAAERGVFVRNDLELPFGESGLAAYAGIDRGWVGGPSAGALAGRQLTGAVLGVRGTHRAFSGDLFVGIALAKPDGFGSARPVTGFLLSLQF